MPPLFQTVTDLDAGADVLRRRRHGMIEARRGSFQRVTLRPFPRLVSVAEILLLGRWWHGYRRGDRCQLYYSQPRRFPDFLALTYVISSRGTTYATLVRVLQVMDEIARIKRSDAILANVSNWRISRRLLARHGWEPHCPSRWQRHYIKRFYGEYPSGPSGGEQSLRRDRAGADAAGAVC